MNALCPSCREADGDVIDRTGDSETGLRIAFACPECDHDWSITL